MTGLAAFLKHPAVVAVVSALIALAATLWIDARAAERAARTEARGLAVDAVTDIAQVRLAAQALFAVLTDPGLSDAERGARADAARAQLLALERAMLAPQASRDLQLSLFFRDRGADPATSPARQLSDLVVPVVAGLSRCVRSADIGMRAFAAGPPDAFYICDPSAPVVEGGTPLRYLDILARAKRCETAVQEALLVSVGAPDKAAALAGEAAAACGRAGPGDVLSVGANTGAAQ